MLSSVEKLRILARMIIQIKPGRCPRRIQLSEGDKISNSDPVKIFFDISYFLFISPFRLTLKGHAYEVTTWIPQQVSTYNIYICMWNYCEDITFFFTVFENLEEMLLFQNRLFVLLEQRCVLSEELRGFIFGSTWTILKTLQH